MVTRNYESQFFKGQKMESKNEFLTVEEALQINLNSKPFTVTMRTPGNDISLVRGLLHSEGIIKDSKYIPEIIIEKENEKGSVSVVNLNLPEEVLGEGYSNSRSLLSVSSCGICGKTELEDLGFVGACIDDDSKFEVAGIQNVFQKMRERQNAFDQSGGSHAAAAFDSNGEILTIMEDIGRHNAVDKVIGDLINKGKLKEAFVLTVSGRISYEIVVKCFKARIPILAAVSAPSSLAVDYAKELGITLFAFCRDDRATCYAHPERIKKSEFINTQAG